MDNPTFSFFTAVFGFVMGAISLLAFLVNTFHSCLPSKMIKVLESLIEETEACLRKGVEDGLLTDFQFVNRTEDRLSELRLHTWEFRYQAHNAPDLLHEYVEFFRGTSFAIAWECSAVKKLRAEIITCIEQERQRLAEVQSAASPAIRSIHVDRSSPACNPMPSLPVLKVWEPGETECASTKNVDAQYRASNIHMSVTLEAGA